mmetsp:Transcript_15244/g.21747  ORF Transcript_15244/g.21747 Transcript_15244/m.21747 type:complete len:83 (+) Transcript_15244:1053-1301(+)
MRNKSHNVNIIRERTFHSHFVVNHILLLHDKRKHTNTDEREHFNPSYRFSFSFSNDDSDSLSLSMGIGIGTIESGTSCNNGF